METYLPGIPAVEVQDGNDTASATTSACHGDRISALQKRAAGIQVRIEAVNCNAEVASLEINSALQVAKEQLQKRIASGSAITEEQRSYAISIIEIRYKELTDDVQHIRNAKTLSLELELVSNDALLEAAIDSSGPPSLATELIDPEQIGRAHV